MYTKVWNLLLISCITTAVMITRKQDGDLFLRLSTNACNNIKGTVWKNNHCRCTNNKPTFYAQSIHNFGCYSNEQFLQDCKLQFERTAASTTPLLLPISNIEMIEKVGEINKKINLTDECRFHEAFVWNTYNWTISQGIDVKYDRFRLQVGGDIEFNGQLLQIQFLCSQGTKCLVVKVEGVFNSILVIPTKKPQTTATTTTKTTTTTATTTAVTTIKTKPPQSTLSDISAGTTPDLNEGISISIKQNSSKVATTAASISVCILLLLLIVAFILYKRRQSKSKVPTLSTTNNVYMNAADVASATPPFYTTVLASPSATSSSFTSTQTLTQPNVGQDRYMGLPNTTENPYYSLDQDNITPIQETSHLETEPVYVEI